MISQTTDIKRIILVRIDPEEDILLAIRKAVEQNNIRNGAIIEGLGSARSIHYHVVASNELPPEEKFPKDVGPYDICTVTGLIIDGRVHAHITFSDDEKMQGGHMEEGCLALTFCIVMLADTPDANYAGWDQIDGPYAP